MKKRTKRIVTLFVTLAMLVSILAACGGNKKTSDADSAYTYWAVLPAATARSQISFNDVMMYQEISKATGVDVSFIHPSQGSTGSEAFQVLLASGEYPDMIEYNWRTYAGGPQQAIDDGVIISLNDYIKEYAPNYYDLMEGEKGKAKDYIYKRQSITLDGNYFGFSGINIGSYRCTGAIYVRYDLLKKWGLDIPVTIDDWDELFATAKANGVEVPFTCEKYALGPDGPNTFNSAWDIGTTFYLDGNKVKYGPFESGYKEMLKKFSEWSSKGYIDKDFVTNTYDEVNANMTNGKSVASHGGIGGTLGKLIPAMKDRNPEYDIAACPYPVMNEGDISRFQDVTMEAADPTIAISVQCGAENKDRYKNAMKWCDFIYSEEGTRFKFFGIEGDTYTIEKDENGEEHFVYTDKIYDHEKINLHSVEDALYHFMRPNSPGLQNHDDYLYGYYPYEQQKEALEVWNMSVEESVESAFPNVFYTVEEAETIAKIKVAALDNLKATIHNIMIGKESIDAYDDAVNQAKKDGYDEYLKINQAAYDRYLKIADN